MMKSPEFPQDNSQQSLPSQSDVKSKISSSLAGYIRGCTINVYKHIRDTFWKGNSYKLGFDEYKGARGAVVRVAKLIDYLQYGGTEEDGSILNSFVDKTETLEKIRVYGSGPIYLKDELLKYFHEEGFRNQINYLSGDVANKLNEMLKNNKGNEQNKKRLGSFFQSIVNQNDIESNYIEPKEYEKLINGLNLDSKAKEDFLLFSVEWRKKKCIGLLKENPPALKKIYDAIIKGEEIDSQVLTNFSYQTQKYIETETVINTRSSAWRNILKKIREFYLSSTAIKNQFQVLINLRSPYALESQFINIYSLLERVTTADTAVDTTVDTTVKTAVDTTVDTTVKTAVDTTVKTTVDTTVHTTEPFALRKLRNYLAHAEDDNRSFKEELIKLVNMAAVDLLKPKDSADITISSFNEAVKVAMGKPDKLPRIMEIVGETDTRSDSRPSNQNLNHCATPSTKIIKNNPSRSAGKKGSRRGARSINVCLFSKEDVDKFSKGKVD